MAEKIKPDTMTGSKRFCSMLGLALLINVYLAAHSQDKPVQDNVLSLKHQSIIPIAAFTAKGDQDRLKTALAEGLGAGLTVNEVKEILVQLYAYAGFPRSLNAISTFQGVLNERKQQGLIEVTGKSPGKQNFKNRKFEFGKDIQTKLTGTTAIGSAQQFVPIIDTLLKEHLFADIFGRDILDFQSREIATISALAGLGGAEGQVRSHLNVGRNVGLTEGQLRAIASALMLKVGKQEGHTVTETLDDMFGVPSGADITAKNGDIGKDAVFPLGNKVTSNNFSGQVWVNMLVATDTVFNTSIGSVTFPPGTRSNWHLHSTGQILLVTEGLGYYQEKGKPVRLLRKGEVVKCLPNVVHWHGAAPNSAMSHIALNPNMEKGNVKWLKKVTKEEYNNLK